MDDAARPAGRAERAAWIAAGVASLAVAGVALAYGVLRVARPGTIFQYTEGPVLGSLAALVQGGSLRDLYPADGWSTPPLVLTLYPPLYFWLSDAVRRAAGAPELLLAPRLLSLAASVAVPAGLAAAARRRGAGWWWTALLVGSLLITPAFFNLVGGAQVDLPAMAFTLGGMLLLLRGGGSGPGAAGEAGALLLFLLAFFTKQSFVAAPAAAALALFAAGRRVRAAVFLGVFAGLAAAGVLLLDRATDGGFAANAFGALRGSAGPRGVLVTVSRSAPWQWAPLLPLALLAAHGRLRSGLPEAYAALAWPLHVAAMARTGASVNYLLEPLVAATLLGIVRAPAAGPPARPARPLRRPAGRLLAGWLLAASVALGAGRLVEVTRAAADRGGFSVVGLRGGHPLAEVGPFAAILREGARPYLNDPFAFGVLLDDGRWDASGLVADLESGAVPFVFTSFDLEAGPAPSGARARDLLFGYLWLAPPIWSAITRAYERAGDGPPYVWLPRRPAPPASPAEGP